MFARRTIALPDRWPPCRYCGALDAVASIDQPCGPVRVACGRGHHRRFEPNTTFGEPTATNAREKRFLPDERRCAELLEQADGCALCGTPPVDDPYRSGLSVADDRELWTWFLRWRPQLFAELALAVRKLQHYEGVTYRAWRLKLPPDLRAAVVAQVADSQLHVEPLIPFVRLRAIEHALSRAELAFAVNDLLIAVCGGCSNGRWCLEADRERYVREYVRAFYDGDEHRARADARRFRTVDAIASRAAAVRLGAA